ncbi:MAG: hypothetical protein V5A15_05330 [Haloarcula sp.]
MSLQVQRVSPEMPLVPDVWAQMAARWNHLQNRLGLVHIALGLLTIVSAPLAVAVIVALLLETGGSQSARPLVPLFVRGGALVFAGASLVVAGHTASTAFQMWLMGSRLRRYDLLLYVGWFPWAGGVYVALGNSFASPR